MNKKGSLTISKGSYGPFIIIMIVSVLEYAFVDYIFGLFHNFGLSSPSLSNWKNSLICISVLSTIIIFFLVSVNITSIKLRGISISQIDTMEGIEFEQYLQKLLIHRGYDVRLTPATGDFGVDLIASRNGSSIAIQAKRQISRVSRRAISDAVAGMNYYGCSDAMVITNNYFTPDAITLAKSTDCSLIDRDTLAKWINDYQNYYTNVKPPTNVQEKSKVIPPTTTDQGKSPTLLLVILIGVIIVCCLTVFLYYTGDYFIAILQ